MRGAAVVTDGRRRVTLMEESISRLAGSHHGVRLDPPQLVAAAHAAGRPAAERTTEYRIRERFDLPAMIAKEAVT